MKPSMELTQWLLHQTMSTVPLKAAPLSRPRARARQMAVWVLRTTCPRLGYPRIAENIGYQDHSTALHGYRLIDVLRNQDGDVRHDTDALLARVKSEKAELLARVNGAHHG